MTEGVMKRVMKVSILAAVILAVAACATINALVTQQELTPAARYYDALVTFNRNVEQYNAVYKLSDAATQAKWKANIDPVIRAASKALDSWKLALNAPDAPAKEQVWQDAAKNLLAMLVSSGIIKVEGGK